MSESQQAKLRQQCLRARRSLTPEQRHIFSARINKNFVQSSLFFRARYIAIYLASFDEVETNEIILRSWRAKKKIFTPVITGPGAMQFCELTPCSLLLPNSFNIPEPVGTRPIDPRKLDVVLTPLVAFDDEGNRIGMGGGFYDRCFSANKNATVWQKPKLVGLAFNCQKVTGIRRNPWDISLSEVFSE